MKEGSGSVSRKLKVMWRLAQAWRAGLNDAVDEDARNDSVTAVMRPSLLYNRVRGKPKGMKSTVLPASK